MKYYKIDFNSFIKENNPLDLVPSDANGELVPDGKYYFDRMGKGEIIQDAPVFDYFFLQSFGEKKDWEWRLQDVHGFMGVGSIISGWYLSDKSKQLFEQFTIAKSYHFYPTKLLYKGEKLDYWIFQFPINPLQNFDYVKSEYYVEGDHNRIKNIHNQEEYDKYDDRLYNETKKSIIWKKTVLTEPFDMVMTMEEGRVVSERLKKAIEDNGLEGFEFSDLDYEVVVG